MLRVQLLLLLLAWIRLDVQCVGEDQQLSRSALKHVPERKLALQTVGSVGAVHGSKTNQLSLQVILKHWGLGKDP